MKDLKDDAAAKELIRDSYVELTNPDFKSDTMNRIYRHARRRRILENVVVNVLAFVAIDALIWLGLKLTGVTVSGLAKNSAALLGQYFLQSVPPGHAMTGGAAVPYFFIVLFVLAAFVALLEIVGRIKEAGSKQ